MRRSLPVAMLLLGACASRLLDDSVDGGAPGLAPDLMAACTTHDREQVPIVLLEPVDDAKALAIGRSVRVHVGVTARAGCDVPGAIDVAASPGDATTFVTLHAWLWRSSAPDDACGPAATVTRVIALDGDNQYLRFVDGGSHTALALPLGGPGPGECEAVAVPAACTEDCQCRKAQAAAGCVPVGADTGACEVTCNSDGDCARAAGSSHCAGRLAATCTTVETARASCASDGDCGFGARCGVVEGEGGLARCVPSQEQVTDQGCACDADCGFGQVCRHETDLSFCAIPCASDGDCPQPMRCLESECVLAGD